MQLTSKLQLLTEWLLLPNDTSSKEMVSDDIDIIIFDAPALAEGTDTIALTSTTDSTLVVIEAGKERPEALQKAQATFQRLGSPIMGVVVNRQQVNHSTYFYANRLHHTTVSMESSHASLALKYPVLQARTFSSRALPETPLPLSSLQTVDGDITQLDTISVPNTNTIKLNRKPYPSRTNGSRPSDHLNGQL